MKTIAALTLALTTLLAGCVAYDQPYHDGRRDYDRGHQRDRDRDGVPNRYDRDRDNDGVPNRMDTRPNDPRRY